jgi:DNA modification methylase
VIAARRLGRKAIGIDASEDYLKQAVTRLTVGDAGIRRMVEARRAGAEQAKML